MKNTKNQARKPHAAKRVRVGEEHMSKDTKVGVVLATILVAVLIAIGYLIFAKLESNNKKGAASLQPESNQFKTLLTRTPEEIDIIKNVEDHIISITRDGFEPSKTIIKPHDQVFWVNDDSKERAVSGDGWGGIPIPPGKRYMKTFAEAGTYKYSDKDNPDITGTVIVK